MMFDPVRKRKSLESPKLGYRRRVDIREQEIGGHRFSLGDSAIRDACACYFCGLDEGARLLAEFGRRLLLEASSMGELDKHPHHNRGHAFRALALAHWLQSAEDNPESLDASTWEYQASDAEGKRPDGHLLDTYLPYHLFAGNFEYVCKRFEKYAKNKIPKNLGSVRTSRVAAFVWAQYKLGGDYGREQAGLAVRSFFDRELEKSLLGRGQFSRAAIWLKILYWNDIENPPSPRDVLRKAYDHMPEVTRPF